MTAPDSPDLKAMKHEITDLKKQLKKNYSARKQKKLDLLKRKYRQLYNRLYSKSFYQKNPDAVKNAIRRWRATDKGGDRYRNYMKNLMRRKRKKKSRR